MNSKSRKIIIISVLSVSMLFCFLGTVILYIDSTHYGYEAVLATVTTKTPGNARLCKFYWNNEEVVVRLYDIDYEPHQKLTIYYNDKGEVKVPNRNLVLYQLVLLLITLINGLVLILFIKKLRRY